MALERERVDQLLEAKKQQVTGGHDAEARLQQAFHQVVSCQSLAFFRMRLFPPVELTRFPIAPSRLGRGTAVLAAPETLLRHHRPRGKPTPFFLLNISLSLSFFLRRV